MSTNRVVEQRRLPRRRRSFVDLSDDDVRLLVEPVLGRAAATATVLRSRSGINNQTYVVRAGPDLGVVVKARPRSVANVRNSPQWPQYTQKLFGPVSNGSIETLRPVAETLGRHGSLRAPRVFIADESLRTVSVPYVVVELIAGHTYGWDSNVMPPAAARQLGAHLGRLHAATAGSGFGIFAQRHANETERWWERFGEAYETLADELARGSAAIARIHPRLRAALGRAVEAGPPPATALVCVDQSPTHYLATEDGTISAIVDLEGHLWAPPEWELAVVELWVRHVRDFRAGYRTYRRYGSGRLKAVRPAYWLFTWMEWLYCLHTLLHDEAGAARMEARLCDVCAWLVPVAPAARAG